MDNESVQVKIIDDPEEVKQMFLKDYHRYEISHHYDERFHFPGQYTYQCSQENMLKYLPNLLASFKQVQTEAIAYLKEDHSAYGDYIEQIPTIIASIDCIDIILALYYINLDDKAMAYDIVRKSLQKDHLKDEFERLGEIEVSCLSVRSINTHFYQHLLFQPHLTDIGEFNYF